MDVYKDSKKKLLSIDELLKLVGEYGFFQKTINLMFCITMFPSAFPVLITYFSTKNPLWKCVVNSTSCPHGNQTFGSSDNLRCRVPRTEWDYVTSRDYSIVTEFDLVCDREYLIEFTTSGLFFGFIFGASTLGWFADNFGRRIVHYISLAIVMLVGFLSVFVGNIYLFIVTRFVIGFFLHGTFPQLYVMISEIVGNDQRALANNVTFISVAIAFCFLALKAYLIDSWKLLFTLCTVPYVFVLLFYFFVPESVRYLRVKGKNEEAMKVFTRMAYWNKTDLPSHISMKPAPSENHKSTPLDLFKTKKIALATCVFCWSAFTCAMTFYSLYLAAGDITGHMYVDFVVITILDIPVTLLNTPLVNRYGRKKVSMMFMLLGSICCISLGLTPKHGKLKILRLVFGMVGKTSVVAAGMARGLWAMEVFSTHIRGEAVGIQQVSNKIGATSAAWIVKHLSRVYKGGVFILTGILIFTAFCLQTFLTDTKGTNIADTENEIGDDIEDSSTIENGKLEGRVGDIEVQVISYSNDGASIEESKVT